MNLDGHPDRRGTSVTCERLAPRLRVAEFDDLFHATETGAPTPGSIDIGLKFTSASGDDLYEQVFELLRARIGALLILRLLNITRPAREAAQGSSVALRVGVPASRHDVLEGLTNHAVAAWTELSHEH